MIFAVTAGAAVVYKWTDADGVVHFSDQPVEGAERIVTSSGSANGIGGSTAGGAAPPTQPSAAPKPKAGYAVFSIDSPGKEQVFFNDDVVPVRLNMDPELRPKQTLSWVLNGSPITDQGDNAISFPLAGLARGAYVLTVYVTDTQTGQRQDSDTVTFYVRQPSELEPLHRK